MNRLTSGRIDAGPPGVMLRVRGWLDSVPYALLALPLRFAVAVVFWNSGLTKLADWNTALTLFATDYRLPFLPPLVAAYTALAIELATPPLLVLGLLNSALCFRPAGRDGGDRNLCLSRGVAHSYPMGGDAAGPAMPRSGGDSA